MLTGILAGLAAHVLATAPAVATPACAAAVAVVEDLWSKPGQPPLSAGAVARFKSPAWKRASELRQGGWSGPVPSDALLTLWEASPPTSATTCGNVSAMSSAKAIDLPVDAAPDSARTTIGLPVLDRSGRQALVQVTTRRNPIGSSVYLYHLRKTGAGWSVVSRRMLAIS